MPRYLISFDDGSMDHIPDEDWPEVGEKSRAAVQEAKEAGVWIFGGGVERQQATIVGVGGAITDGPAPETRRSSAGSRSSRCPRGRRRWSGLPASPAAADARKRYGRSCTTRPLESRLCSGGSRTLQQLQRALERDLPRGKARAIRTGLPRVDAGVP